MTLDASDAIPLDPMSDTFRDLRESSEALFSTEIGDTTIQRHIMAYVTAKVVQDVVKVLAELDGLLGSVARSNPLRFEMGMNLLIPTASILPLVLNADDTLSMVRRPLVPLLRHHILPFSDVVRIVANDGQIGLIGRFRPWSRRPDALGEYIGGLGLDAVWKMTEEKLEELFEGCE